MHTINRKKLHKLMVKIMKGDANFRLKSKATIQSANEIYVYKNVIPCFTEYAKGTDIDIEWIAKVYFADFGVFAKLSDDDETILALEDLNASGFQMSPSKIDLDAMHLRVMARKIASFHAVSFEMKIEKNPMLEQLASGLIPFSFKSETHGDLEAYKFLCPHSFQRLFKYVARTPKHHTESFLADLENLKPKVADDFLQIMENFLINNHDFAAILHGDYYRNNSMFRYEQRDGANIPVDMRMFDFQEVRFATIGIDLSIFMFMHIPESLKALVWDELLELYHKSLLSSLAKLLKCEDDDERLAPYSFDKFINHFRSVAFYGAAVSVLSIPWMASPEEETKRISEYFETDMHHPDFLKLLHVAGGDEIDERVVSNVKHASHKGYLKIFE